MRIAVVDNDKSRVDQICTALKGIGHACQHLHGVMVPEYSRQEVFDLLILNWLATDTGRISAEYSLRTWSLANVPVLCLADRGDEDGIAAAMGAGASDYLIKPLRIGELVTRVQVLLKRAYPERTIGEQIRLGAYTFEPISGRVTIAGKPIEVTQKEFELALLFFRNIGRPLSRAYILEAIWTHEPDIASRTMDTHVSRVRSKLALRPENGYRLAPVYGYGYQLEQFAK